MGKVTGFLENDRELPAPRPAETRINDWKEIYLPFSDTKVQEQAARCMDCGVPFCHTGCPLGNIIPDWNDLVYRNQWREALDRLHATNNFPEFTGRICPAPCENACVLAINEPAVAIEQIEQAIVERGWKEGWIKPQVPAVLTGKRVAVVGSGPAGLACAQQLRRVGHEVKVFEREDRIGGLLRYGIPEFKMEKKGLNQRLDQMKAEGVVFVTGAHVGVNLDTKDMKKEFDAIVLCGGSTRPRDLEVPGRNLKGIYFAMDYLPQANRVQEGDEVQNQILATGKDVVIIGGGDTGADCLGTAHRQGAKSILQLELLPRPPEQRGQENPWPQWANIFRTSGAHKEGGERRFSIMTEKFSGSQDQVEKLHIVELAWKSEGPGPASPTKIAGTEKEIPANLVLLAMGFLGPETNTVLSELGVKINGRGNVEVDPKTQMTNVPGIFSAGDMSRGQSLVVWAIAEGRKAARGTDLHLMGDSSLPTN